jgi:signal peptidase I
VKANIKKEIASWAKTIAFSVLLAVFINKVLIVNAMVPTGSMEGNIMADDRIVASRLSYIFSAPKRFDIVVFRYPDDRSTLYVKRIIGLPGETLSIRQGKVYIGDSAEPLDDSFVPEPPRLEDSGPYIVPADSYFMMGDNRNCSADSRYWTNKFVARSEILGKALLRYYPGFHLLYSK